MVYMVQIFSIHSFSVSGFNPGIAHNPGVRWTSKSNPGVRDPGVPETPPEGRRFFLTIFGPIPGFVELQNLVSGFAIPGFIQSWKKL